MEQATDFNPFKVPVWGAPCSPGSWLQPAVSMQGSLRACVHPAFLRCGLLLRSFSLYPKPDFSFLFGFFFFFLNWAFNDAAKAV